MLTLNNTELDKQLNDLIDTAALSDDDKCACVINFKNNRPNHRHSREGGNPVLAQSTSVNNSHRTGFPPSRE